MFRYDVMVWTGFILFKQCSVADCYEHGLPKRLLSASDGRVRYVAVCLILWAVFQNFCLH